jgi:hypothetical protein
MSSDTPDRQHFLRDAAEVAVIAVGAPVVFYRRYKYADTDADDAFMASLVWALVILIAVLLLEGAFAPCSGGMVA